MTNNNVDVDGEARDLMKRATEKTEHSGLANDPPEDWSDDTSVEEENLTGKRSSMRTSSLFYKVVQ